MKHLLRCCLCLFFLPFSIFAQTRTLNEVEKTVSFSAKNFNVAQANFVQSNGLVKNMATQLPIPNGNLGSFILNETLLGETKNVSIQTFDGVSADGTIKLKLTVTAEKIEGLMHTPEGYFVIEPFDVKQDLYLVYSMSEIPSDRMKCGALGETFNAVNKNGRVLSTAPFPIGTQMRNYRLAAAATGELTGFYTNQAGAVAQITSIMNAANLIYELEASIHFTLTSATTGYSIIFTNAATDPFTVDPSFANAANSQTGFTAMNTSSVLPYANYDVGHTFNTLTAISGGYSISGQAGPTPCQDASKSRGWTEWTFNAALGAIVNVFVHEVGHQFSAPHTFNAVGGPSSGSTFCTGGWSATSAIEPGSGATLMGYANNCTSPNYTLSGSNNLNYFHTKSLELIYNAVLGSSGTCITQTATGNTPPVSNAGSDVVIPKGTPFKLTGTASDANGDAMSYTWEQYDVATTNDKGAFGSSILGTGGYYAVNSTTAPLFRSQMSSTALDRTFPKLTHILNSANDPADSEAEDLPQVARSMKFRFTVRDNRANGGGVDSDETIVTVDNSGPFLLTSQNSPTLWIYNGTNTANLTWSVNGTNAAPLSVANVKITLSTDGGTTFPITLLTSTANDGTETITIPNNLTTQGRIKIEPVGTYAFFDINNVNITITNTCNAEVTSITPTTAVSAQAGNAALNLGLSPYGSVINTISGTIDVGDTPSNLTYINPSNVCNGPSNSNYVELQTFIAGTTGNYTFTNSAGFSFVTNLYSTSFSNTSVCTNFLNSNAKKLVTGGSVTLYGSFTQTLTAGQQYVLVSQGFNSSALGSYTVTVTPPSGGGIYSVAPASGSPYDYTYLAVNSTGNIAGFSSTSDFTNSAIYTADTYTVYGLSYQGGLNLSAYVGTSLTSFQALLTANTVCGKLSSNSKTVTITPCTPPTVAAISGASAVCVGSTITLTDATAGGVWSSSASTSIATISASGVVTGVSAGTTTITYSVTTNGCVGTATKVITINAIPTVAAIGGASSVCVGATTTLTDATASGVWSSSASTSIATINASGVVTGVGVGSTTITYTVTTNGCVGTATKSVSINSVPAVAGITGTTTICTGGNTTLADVTPSGVWNSATTSVATIGASGIVTGVSAGTSTIGYSVTVGGCTGLANIVVTVNPTSPTPTAQANTQIALGANITLTATGCSGASGTFALKWYKASDNSAVTMPVSPTTTTSYYAKCEQTLNGTTCSSSNSANVSVAVSADVVSIASGNWESPSTWNVGRVPLSTDKVLIDTTHIVTVTTNNAHANKIEYRGTGKILYSSASSKLYVGL